MTHVTATKKNRPDHRQTVQFDKVTWLAVHEMAEETGSNVSQVVRMLIRQAIKDREDA